MSRSRHLLPLLLLALATVGSARAVEPEAVATAPGVGVGVGAGAPPISIADQIDTYLKTSPGAQIPKDRALGVTPGGEEPRAIHGVVDVAVGTSGYRSAYVRSDIPVGQTGTLSIAASETQFNGRGGRGVWGRGFGAPYGGGDHQSLSIGLALGGAGDSALDPHDPRCRQVRADGSDPTTDPRFEDSRSRGCRTAASRTGP